MFYFPFHQNNFRVYNNHNHQYYERFLSSCFRISNSGCGSPRDLQGSSDTSGRTTKEYVRRQNEMRVVVPVPCRILLSLALRIHRYPAIDEHRNHQTNVKKMKRHLKLQVLTMFEDNLQLRCENLEVNNAVICEIRQLQHLIAFASSKQKNRFLVFGGSAFRTNKDVARRIREWKQKLKRLKHCGIVL
jgi:hypothetical protein